MGSKQQRNCPAFTGLVQNEFPQRADAQGQGGMGGVHASFFARAGIVNASQSS